MKGILIRDKKRRSLEHNYFYKRLALNYLLRCKDIQKDTKKYYSIRKQLEKLPRNSSRTRLQNRCVLTGYSYSVHKKFKLSRISIRNLGLTGQLAGLTKVVGKMLTNNIADLLTRIRNGQRQKLNFVYALKTKLNLNILNCLIEEGYIKSYSFENLNDFYIKINLKYDEYNAPIIKRLVLVSKSSRRVYGSVKMLLKFHEYNSGHSLLILSTNKGIMSHQKALDLNVGGEVICKIT